MFSLAQTGRPGGSQARGWCGCGHTSGDSSASGIYSCPAQRWVKDSGVTSPGRWPVVLDEDSAAHEGGATGSPACGGCRWAAWQPEAWVRVRIPGSRSGHRAADCPGCARPRPGLTSVIGVDHELGGLSEECSSLSAIQPGFLPAPPGGGGCPSVQGPGEALAEGFPTPPMIARAAQE